MKKTSTSKKLFSILFLIVILVIFLLVVNSEAEKAAKHFEKESGAVWTGAQEYPLSAPEVLPTEDDGSAGFFPKLSALIDKVQLFINTGATSQFNLQMPFVIITKYVDRYVWDYSLTTSLNGTEKEDNSAEGIGIVVDSGDNALYLIVADKSIDDNVQCLIDFAHEMESHGRSFLFMEIPVNAYGEDRLSEYPAYYQDYSDKYTDILVGELESGGIPVVSMSSVFDEEGLTARDIFQRTDHHWYPQSALMACGSLAEGLNKYCGYEIDVSAFDISNYTIDFAPNGSFGSLGKKVSEVYSIPEKLPLLIPKYDSDVTAFISKTGQTRTGSISETLFNWNLLDSKDIYTYRWGFYGYGDQALVSIHNNLINDGKRILILRNSFADAMVPYLSNLAEYVDIVQLDYFDGSLQSFIEETDPDTVVVAYTLRVFQGTSGSEGENFNFK